MKYPLSISFFLFFHMFSADMFYSQSGDKLTDGLYHLAEYIVSDEMSDSAKVLTQLELIDLIYKESIIYFDGDISEALLCMTFVSLPFKEMPLVLPIINSEINFPLPSVEEPLNTFKNSNLPSNYLYQSPISKNSDKDKTAHFFGNAYLSYSVTFLNLSDFLGGIVELFEAAFKVNGFLDDEDLMINELGSKFGKYLREEPKVLPSRFFYIYNYLQYSNRFYN